MTIVSVSHEERKATITLDSCELVELCNAMYFASTEKEITNQKRFYHIYGDLMMARDLSQYGHLDGFSFNSIAECREKSDERR